MFTSYFAYNHEPDLFYSILCALILAATKEEEGIKKYQLVVLQNLFIYLIYLVGILIKVVDRYRSIVGLAKIAHRGRSTIFKQVVFEVVRARINYLTVN
jgi:hypothetical protein